LRITGQEDVNTITKSQTQGVYDAPKPTASSERSVASQEPAGDQVEIGSQSLLSQAQTGTEPSAYIEQLRALVQSGQYQVDSAALSQSIVSSALNGY